MVDLRRIARGMVQTSRSPYSLYIQISANPLFSTFVKVAPCASFCQANVLLPHRIVRKRFGLRRDELAENWAQLIHDFWLENRRPDGLSAIIGRLWGDCSILLGGVPNTAVLWPARK